jgi:hypothetical protein
MGAMKAVYIEMAEDFENLTETSMEFSGNGWEAQDGRFEGKTDYSMRYIYWFDNYANLMAGRNILQQFGDEYEVLFDDVLGQWTIITNYQTMAWCM